MEYGRGKDVFNFSSLQTILLLSSSSSAIISEPQNCKGAQGHDYT